MVYNCRTDDQQTSKTTAVMQDQILKTFIFLPTQSTIFSKTFNVHSFKGCSLLEKEFVVSRISNVKYISAGVITVGGIIITSIMRHDYQTDSSVW